MRRNSATATHLRPLPAARTAYALAGLVIAMVAVYVGSADFWGARVLLVLGTLLGLGCAFRWSRVGVSYEGELMTVFGWFGTRTIERASIIEINEVAAVRWAKPDDGRGWTPLPFGTFDGPFPSMARHSERCLVRLRAWAFRGSRGRYG